MWSGCKCPHCGELRGGPGRFRTVFSDAELIDIERILEGRCFLCWKHEHVVTAEEREQQLVVYRTNSAMRQQLRQMAQEIAGNQKGMWLEEVICHHCHDEATMVVVGHGGKPAQVKVLCSQCKTYWL